MVVVDLIDDILYSPFYALCEQIFFSLSLSVPITLWGTLKVRVLHKILFFCFIIVINICIRNTRCSRYEHQKVRRNLNIYF